MAVVVPFVGGVDAYAGVELPGEREALQPTGLVMPVWSTVVLDLYETWYKIPTDEAGTTFDAQCAVLCGAKHADMSAEVRAVTPEECEI